MVTAQQRVSDAGQAGAAATEALEIPESPEVFYGGMEDDGSHSAPTTGPSAQQHQRQQARLQPRSGSIAAAARQLDKQLKQSSRRRQKRGRVCTRNQAAKKPRLTALTGAGQAAGSGSETESDGDPESEDFCPDSEDDAAAGDDSSDAEWSPEQPEQEQHKRPRRKATLVKTPTRQPFPEIQHSMAHARHLSSPTKNKLITDCFAAVTTASPAEHRAHSPALEAVAEQAAPATSTLTATETVTTADAGTAQETSGTSAVTDPDAEEDARGSNAASTGEVDDGVIVISDSDCGSESDGDGVGDDIAGSSKYESEVHSGDEEALEEQQQSPDDDPDLQPQPEQQQQPCQQHQQQQVLQLPAEASTLQLTQRQQPCQQPSQQHEGLGAGWGRSKTQIETFSMCKRSLSVTQIRENAAAEKAARLEAASQRTAMHLTQGKAAAAAEVVRPAAVMQRTLSSAPGATDAAKAGNTVHVARASGAEVSRKHSAAAAGPPDRSVAAAAPVVPSGAAAADASSPDNRSQLRTPAKADAKTPSSEEQRQHSAARV